MGIQGCREIFPIYSLWSRAHEIYQSHLSSCIRLFSLTYTHTPLILETSSWQAGRQVWLPHPGYPMLPHPRLP